MLEGFSIFSAQAEKTILGMAAWAYDLSITVVWKIKMVLEFSQSCHQHYSEHLPSELIFVRSLHGKL